MYKILDGKQTTKNIKAKLKEEIEGLKQKGLKPGLAVILVGNDPASEIYVNLKAKSCKELGIHHEQYCLKKDTTQTELIELIKKLNNDDKIHGILLQSPIPKHLNIQEAFDTIDPKKDVDGFTAINVGRLDIGQDALVSCTPFGVMKLLEEYNIELEGKNAVIIGRSNIVGKPMFKLLLAKNATVTVCHSRTKDLKEHTKKADILVAAIGRPSFVTKDMVKDGAVVVDVGINRLENGKVVGDVDFERVKDVASYITPVPGGIGPMTISMLMYNVVLAAKIFLDKNM